MIRHFGVLIPSTDSTIEIKCRLLPPYAVTIPNDSLEFGRASGDGIGRRENTQ